ncbi:MutS -like protein 5 [Acetobacter orientalis]|uniref:MutS-like protein 5 n=1 Tax=Acetobacter orientalis TaxID=146474 RepID=A0A2Z5ZL99_9PROT|nr:MutS -like protein 5 [Acetobacter orientalis]
MAPQSSSIRYYVKTDMREGEDVFFLQMECGPKATSLVGN